MSLADAFDPLRSALQQAGVRYAIGGSWASTAFGEARLTNDVDILADFNEQNLIEFIRHLPTIFYADEQDALSSVRAGRPFNVLYMPIALKFDFFPAAAYPLGVQELNRAVPLPGTALSRDVAFFVTPEDIVLAKLRWFRLGGEVSEVQWRDVRGVVRACAATLDRSYLQENAATLGVSDLLQKLLEDALLP